MPSKEYKDLLDKAWDLHVGKNAGYAGADNPDPWANFRMSEAFGVPAFEGCMVRLSDKYARVASLMRNPLNEQVGESIRDTLRDLSAYALIAVCLLDEKKETDEPRFEPFPGPDIKFLCGHRYGEEPIVGKYPGEANCGSAVHWSRVNGIELK